MWESQTPATSTTQNAVHHNNGHTAAMTAHAVFSMTLFDSDAPSYMVRW
jgi:hypothetical protein